MIEWQLKRARSRETLNKMKLLLGMYKWNTEAKVLFALKTELKQNENNGAGKGGEVKSKLRLESHQHHFWTSTSKVF